VSRLRRGGEGGAGWGRGEGEGSDLITIGRVEAQHAFGEAGVCHVCVCAVSVMCVCVCVRCL